MSKSKELVEIIDLLLAWRPIPQSLVDVLIEERKEIDTKYKLSSYYKYFFTFRSLDGLCKSFCIGGDAGDIYRLEIDADKEYTLEELEAMN